MGTHYQFIATIGEARMNSWLLPRKVLLPADGKPLPEDLANCLRAVPSNGKVLIPITGNAADATLVALAGHWGISSFRHIGPHVMRCVA